jgi:hypothetical protein
MGRKLTTMRILVNGVANCKRFFAKKTQKIVLLQNCHTTKYLGTKKNNIKGL